MDYDQSNISSRYDAARALSTSAMSRLMDPICAAVSAADISIAVDVGCGTGRFSGALRDRLCDRVIGLEPSRRMIHEARRKFATSDYFFLQSTAEALPLPTDFADMAFMSMVYHHLVEPEVAARELRRIVRPNGYLCVRNSLIDLLDTFVHLQFFPSARTHLERKLPNREDLLELFAETGFESILVKDIESVFAESFSKLQAKVSLRAQSELIAISNKEFEAGLAEMGNAAGSYHEHQPISISTGLFIFRKTA